MNYVRSEGEGGDHPKGHESDQGTEESGENKNGIKSLQNQKRHKLLIYANIKPQSNCKPIS